MCKDGEKTAVTDGQTHTVRPQNLQRTQTRVCKIYTFITELYPHTAVDISTPFINIIECVSVFNKPLINKRLTTIWE